MKAVILRDDDANALTSPEVLDRLYRPFLDRGMPVCLATIPEVRLDIEGPDGEVEGFLMGPDAGTAEARAIGDSPDLCRYLRSESGYSVAQHGLRHERVHGRYEFDHDDVAEIRSRLDRGSGLLRGAGFPKPACFVAPQDSLSRAAVREAMSRFPVISTGYYDLGRVPRRLWPGYLFTKKVRRCAHFRSRRTVFLTHPGCILSHHRSPDGMMEALRAVIDRQRMTVVVSHHWEYFRGGHPDEPFIGVLHELADYLHGRRDIKVIRFDEARPWAP